MKIPNHIKQKMHRLARIQTTANELIKELDDWFDKYGFDIEKLRCGNGISLEELNYGNDVTDELCDWIERNEGELR